MRMRVWWLGRREYSRVLDLQRRLVEQIAAGNEPDTLLLLEHEPVLTVGRGTDPLNLPADGNGLPIHEIERGGEATWHGPGQLVGYPILRLGPQERDLHLHLRRLEELLIDTCGDVGCASTRRDGLTGVWTPASQPSRKVASIGVAVRRWTTYHGFALNVRVDPSAFHDFNPCGLDGTVMTSLDREISGAVTMAEVIESLVGRLEPTFQRRPAMEHAPL